MVNVGKYTSPMDPMGKESETNTHKRIYQCFIAESTLKRKKSLTTQSESMFNKSCTTRNDRDPYNRDPYNIIVYYDPYNPL